MPNYDSKIVQSFFDTHLTVRVKELKWGKDFKIECPPASGPVHDKLETIKEIVKAIPTRSIQEAPMLWIAFTYKLAELEEREHAIKESNRNYPLTVIPMGRLVVGEESMEERAAHAARGFIVAELLTHSKATYKAEKTRLFDGINFLKGEIEAASNVRNADPAVVKKKSTDLAELEKKYKALNDAENDKYHERFFFPEIIKKRDQRVDLDNKPLNEDTFAAYYANVINGARKTTNLDKLMNPPAPVATAAPAATVAPAPAATTANPPAASVTGGKASFFPAPANVPEIIDVDSTSTSTARYHNTRASAKRTN